MLAKSPSPHSSASASLALAPLGLASSVYSPNPANDLDGDALAGLLDLLSARDHLADTARALLALGHDGDDVVLLEPVGELTALAQESGRHHIRTSEQELDRAAVDLDLRQEVGVLVQQAQVRDERAVIVVEEEGALRNRVDAYPVVAGC